MIWRSATGANIYGVATNSFVQEDKPHRLSLDVGDAVIILKETTNWYYGYKHRNSDEMGIFPKTYIHLCECVIKKNEYVIKRTGIVEEITSVLREWGTILKKFYLTRHDKFHIVRQKLLQLIYLRSLLLSGNLPLDEMRRVKLMATSEIDTGNSILGLDMVVRDDLGDILNINTVCTTQLYEYHVHAAARIKKAFSPQNHIKPTRCINKHSHNLLLSVHAFICKIQEDSDLLFTLYDNERQRPLTENYVLKWSRQGINRDLESFNNNRVLFTDLSSDDLNSSKIYLVCFAVKISQTDVDSRNSSSSFISTPNKKLSQISHNSNSTGTGEKIRKPLGVAAIDLTPVLKKPEDFKNNLDLPFTLCEKENLDTTLKRLISNKDISKIDSKLAVSVEVLHGDMKQIKEEYPHILRGNILIARKMGFPEIIFPGDVRNDLYLTLVSGEFSKGIKNSDKNIEVTIAVYNDKGIMVPEVISLGVGLPSVSEYKSIVYYHEDKPRWMETFKVHVSVEEFKRCHLKFTLKHRRSNEQKDKIEKPFALAYIPLMQLNGTTIQQGYHKLNIFKIDYKKYDKDDPLAYIDLSFKGGDMSGNNKLSALGLSLTTKDYLIIDSNLCSTKLTEDVTLLGVLNWTSRKDNLEAALKHLNMVAESEVVKFLQDILDALFNILVQNNDPEKYNPLVFMCLIRLIEIVHDRKYEHFQSVLNLYISESFCATLAYEKLIKVLGDQIIDATRQQDGMNSVTNEIDGDKTPSERLFKTTKQIHYIIKFIVKSRILFADLNDNSGFEEFEKSIEDLLQLFTNMIACRNDLLKPEGALLKYLHIIASDLMEVYDCIKLSHNIVDIITRFPPGRLTQSKMACIKDFIDSKLFHIPKCREVLLPVFCKQIKDRLESKEEGDSKTDIWQQEKNLMKAAKVLGELKSQLHSRETTVKSKISECVVIMNNILKLIFRPDVGQVENDIIEIVLKLLRTIIQTSIAMDRDNPLVGNLVAIMLGIFHSMSTKHYEIYVESFNTKYDLQDFLTEILLVFKDLVSKPVFPSDWMDMIMHQNTVILESLRQLSLIVIKKFFNQFEKQVWSNFFQCSIAFLIQQPLQLELFSEEKHLTIRSKYKDIRRLTAIEIQKMWFQLGEYKNQFIPQLVGPILEMSMIPEIELRKTTIPIFFDMMQCEYYSSRYITESYGDTKRNNTHYKANFNEFETEMIEKLDILVTAGRGDYEYKEIFYELMSQLCSSHNTLNTKGLNFVNIVTKLLERLLEYRCIIHDESIENKMACTVSLLQFYSEVNRKEMYIRYVYKLCDLHMEFDNYTEAAFTLQLHSNLLSWDDIELIPIFKSNRHINCRTHRQLKEALYYDIIHYFEKGKMWECAIDMCKQLAIQYEHETFNYLSLSAIYKKIAEFFENILKKMRHDCEYFRVAFYGLKFPEFLRNKVFVYRGKEYERLSDFCTRILMQHPSAELMQTLTVPGKEITHSEAQFIQINNIEPIMEEKYQKFNSSTAISKEIIKYYRTNNVQKFRFSRNLDSKGADSGVDNIWLERTIMKTSFPLPGILRWFPVISTEKVKISPIQHAIETMENTNNALRDLIIAHKMDEDLPINQLSMKINGIVDPAVMGGSGKYEQAFLIPEYLEKNPEHKDLVIKLKDLIASQIPLLEIALSVHRLKTPPSLILFHERLENCFTELQTNIESKYGKRTCDLKINHDDYVVLRRGKTIAQGSSDCNNRLSETSNTSSDSGRVKSTHGNRSQTNSIKSTLVNFNFNTVTLNRTSSNSSTGLKNKNKNKAEKRRSYKKFDRETVPPPVSNSQWYTLATGPTIINSMLSEDSLRSLYDGTPNTSLLYELREQLTPKRPLRSEAEKERRLSRPTSVSSQNFNMQELETSAPSLVTKECDDIYSIEKEENSVRPPLPSKLRDSSDLTNCNLQQNISSIEEQLFTEKDDKKRPPTPPPKPNRNSRCTSSL